MKGLNSFCRCMQIFFFHNRHRHFDDQHKLETDVIRILCSASDIDAVKIEQQASQFTINTGYYKSIQNFFTEFKFSYSTPAFFQSLHVLYRRAFDISSLNFFKHQVEKRIRKTCPCNIYPRKSHFYIAKLGFEGVYLFFLILIQNIHCGYSLEPPRRGGSNLYPQCMF